MIDDLGVYRDGKLALQALKGVLTIQKRGFLQSGFGGS